MPVYGRRGKPKAGFPLRPQTLEIANGAIPTFPPSLRLACGKVEIQKQDSHFPTGFFFISKKEKKGAWRLILYENQIGRSGSFLDENMLPLKRQRRPLLFEFDALSGGPRERQGNGSSRNPPGVTEILNRRDSGKSVSRERII